MLLKNRYNIQFYITKKPVVSLTWIKGNFTQNESVIKFNTKLPMPNEIKNLETPKGFFNYFFVDGLLSIIVDQTELYSTQVNSSKPINLSKTELQRFLGIFLMMSIDHVPNSISYLSDNLGNIPIKNCTRGNNFEKIKIFLHFNNYYLDYPPNHENRDKLFNIRPVIELLRTKFLFVRLLMNV